MTDDTEQKDHFVVVPDESPVSRTSWRVKQGPMTKREAESEAERLKRHSERRYQARSGESLNLFPHLFTDDRQRGTEQSSTATEQGGDPE